MSKMERCYSYQNEILSFTFGNLTIQMRSRPINRFIDVDLDSSLKCDFYLDLQIRQLDLDLKIKYFL